MWIVLNYFAGNYYRSYAQIKKRVIEVQDHDDKTLLSMNGTFFEDEDAACKYARKESMGRNQPVLILYIEPTLSKVMTPTVKADLGPITLD